MSGRQSDTGVCGTGWKPVPHFCILLLVVWSPFATAEFRFDENAGRLTLSENGQLVFVYNFGRVDPPEGLDADRYWRESYIHPLYGLDGEVVTEDFPADHVHQRGVFWTWPECRVGDRKMDAWTIVGVRQRFEKWIDRSVSDDGASFTVQNGWYFDNETDPVVRETISVAVDPAKKKSRAVDFRLTFQNVSNRPVVFEGAKDKGYGGFCFRPDASNKPLQFVTDDGYQEEDRLWADTPWAAVFWGSAKTDERAGAAIFQHPSNPDYPHSGWTLRHYGLLGAAWPHEEPRTFQPGEKFELQYRLMIYRGGKRAQKINRHHDHYVKVHNAQSE